MKYKYIALAVLLFVGVGIVHVEASVLSDSFINLIQQKSLNSRISFHDEFTTKSSSNSKNDYIDVGVASRGDSSVPSAVRLDNSISAGTNMLTGFGIPEFNITLNIRAIGDTIYFQLPNLPYAQYDPELGSTLAPFENQWIRISKQDIDAIATDKDMPADEVKDLRDSFDKAVTTNQQPIAQTVPINDWIKKYDKVFSLKKYKSRTVSGTLEDGYILTINKKILSNFLITDIIASDKNMSLDDRDSVVRDINDGIAHVNFKSMMLYIGRSDKLPHEFKGIVQTLDEKKKVNSTMNIGFTFSEFGSHFDDITTPAQFKTIADFYYTVVKPSLKNAQQKGINAELKSSLSSFRAQAELVYTYNNGNYGTTPNNGSCTSPLLGSVFNPTSPQVSSDTKGLISEIINSSSSASCYSTPTAWAMQATYKDNSGSFCSDSTGVAKETHSQLSGTSCGN